ncbi:MAG: Asp23/Gls24 family envelope stress response protein [Christensenellaceae bacterium]|jgi:uncharacterized alkaline shock family protein YloU|nr:Asp23/Gls24 family envelope stress response protein [Christensenellaceae bacterium]
MSVSTFNLYGNIIVTNQALQTVAANASLECYGILGVKKVRIWTSKNKVAVSINVVVSFGVSIDPLLTSIRSAVKYKLENFAGMPVVFINVKIVSIKKS